MRTLGRFLPLLLALLLSMTQPLAHAADIFGYVDERGVAHFAPEKLDERYQLFFRGGQSFDTADGIGPLLRGRAGKVDGKVPRASQTLLALFEASPSYKPAQGALREAARRHAIDYELLQALIATESGFDAQAVSPKGALGLMQLMPATAQRYGVQADKRGSLEKKLFDPRINIAAGSRYLSDLIEMFPGDIELALAAYNAGEGAVQRAGNKIPNYRETQNYVKTVLQLYAYLKPSAAAGRGGKAPGRVRMELAPPRGGALGRGNMPPDSRGVPAMPSLPEPPQGLRLDPALS
ncbi:MULTISPECIES: lytic transglycosylase domain-containing protein [unclassified Variovorax]|uniref:lytic transglycosylase domain-containing protein n=1 Tax=unclassified Variovorax TaxID=663243 RepID=UPI00087EA7DF|nr:lytic transglycosylase domain-containing protein [Variovorax sp. CF079]SDC14572.1 Transglycosylase SLT domain-containing protein [Variovorax sp. CF079]